MGVRVDHVKLFPSELRDAVHVDRSRRVGLVDGKTNWPPVHLAGRCVNHPGVWSDAAKMFQKSRVSHGVVMQVCFGIGHRRGMADLSGKVEDDIGPVEHVCHQRIAKVAFDDFDVGRHRQALEIATVSAVVGDQRIDDSHRCTTGSKSVHDVGADESETAGDYDNGSTQRVVSPPRLSHRGMVASWECALFSPRRDPGSTVGHNRTMDADEYQRMAVAGEQHWWYDATRRLLQQLLDEELRAEPVTGGRVFLDAGGGTGATGGWLAGHATTVLADFDAGALAVACTQTSEAAHPVLPVRADLNHLPYADDAFDGVLCVTALYHRMNTDPGAIVADFARITRPGGWICLLEPGVRRLRRGHDEVTHTARRFSLSDLRSLAAGAGLEEVRATGAFSFLVPPAAVLSLIERGTPTSDVGRNGSGLGGVLGTLARVERAWLRRRDLPAGLSAVVLARRPTQDG